MFKKIFLVVSIVPTVTQTCGDAWFKPLTPEEAAAEQAAYAAHIAQFAPHDDHMLQYAGQAAVRSAEARQRPVVASLPQSVRTSSRLGNGPRSPRLMNTATGCVVLDGSQQ